MDAESRKRIFTGTIFTASFGAATGTIASFLNNRPLFRNAFIAGLNCGIIGCTFFCFRESFLLYQKKHNPKLGLKDYQTRNYDEFISSTLAGGMTEGSRQGIIPGFIVFSLLCGAGQYCYTSLYNLRQQLILEEIRDKQLKKSLPENAESENNKNNKDTGIFAWLATKNWSPVRKITKEEYFRIRKERLREKGIDMEDEEDSNINFKKSEMND
ncbi:3745_t:CDS:2 [Diversispora eburnea]|uniref:3745_t:CDS:1 n=1 Tax=Diversispora eburnea TaxID=1213867 RepID=A0A9N9GL90_9GLOM|nr:3745_t:CDS:2 [Diversispora eburnea]